jgi:hypothetical protein
VYTQAGAFELHVTNGKTAPVPSNSATLAVVCKAAAASVQHAWEVAMGPAGTRLWVTLYTPKAPC